MHLFATDALIGARLRDLRDEGASMIGTTRIAALVRRYEDEVKEVALDPFTTGPVDQRREAA